METLRSAAAAHCPERPGPRGFFVYPAGSVLPVLRGQTCRGPSTRSDAPAAAFTRILNIRRAFGTATRSFAPLYHIRADVE